VNKNPLNDSAINIPQAAHCYRENAAALDFHGASVINERGEETPITEIMVQAACNAFIQQWEVSQNPASDSAGISG
jgi:hypothetical protein